MKIKSITLLGLFLGGFVLCFMTSFSTMTQKDPWARYSACYEQCISGKEEKGCSKICDSDGWKTFLVLNFPVIWKAESRIPILRGSSGSNMILDREKPVPYPLFKFPNDKPIKMVAGIPLGDELSDYTVEGQLRDVRMTISFLDEKRKIITMTGSRSMKSAAFDIEKLGVTQKFKKRSSFRSLKQEEVAYFIVEPDFGDFQVKGLEIGAIIVEVSSLTKMGTRKVISTAELRTRYADEATYKELIQKQE